MATGLINRKVRWQTQPTDIRPKIDRSNALAKHLSFVTIPTANGLYEAVTKTVLAYSSTNVLYGQGSKGRHVETTAADADYFSLPGTSTFPGLGDQRTFAALVNATEIASETTARPIFTYGDQATGQRWTFKPNDTSNNLRIEIQGSGYTSSLAVPANKWVTVGCRLFGGDTIGDHEIFLDAQVDKGASGSNQVITDILAGDPSALMGHNHSGLSSTYGFYGKLAIAALFDSGEEWVYREFLRNPWQMFEPRSLYMPVSDAAASSIIPQAMHHYRQRRD